jgi:hypothetical protein
MTRDKRPSGRQLGMSAGLAGTPLVSRPDRKAEVAFGRMGIH